MRKPVLGLAAAAVLGVVTGVAWPPPPIPRAQQLEPPWALPAADTLQRYSQDQFQAARRSVGWQGEDVAGGAGDSGGPDRGWRLAGLVAGPELAALILRGGESAPTRVQVGGSLPDGSTVRDIRHDGITTESGGCLTVYRLHRQAPVDTSGECADATQAAEPREKAT